MINAKSGFILSIKSESEFTRAWNVLSKNFNISKHLSEHSYKGEDSFIKFTPRSDVNYIWTSNSSWWSEELISYSHLPFLLYNLGIKEDIIENATDKDAKEYVSLIAMVEDLNGQLSILEAEKSAIENTLANKIKRKNELKSLLNIGE